MMFITKLRILHIKLYHKIKFLKAAQDLFRRHIKGNTDVAIIISVLPVFIIPWLTRPS